MKKSKKPYWYQICYGECPVCGRSKSYRYRVYGKKPKDPHKTHIYLSDEECYDWCDVL